MAVLTVTPELLRAVRGDRVLAITAQGYDVLPAVQAAGLPVLPLAELAGSVNTAIRDEHQAHRLPDAGAEVIVVTGAHHDSLQHATVMDWPDAWWADQAALRPLTTPESTSSVWSTRSGHYLVRHPGSPDTAGRAVWAEVDQLGAATLLYRVGEQHLVLAEESRLVSAVRAGRALAGAIEPPADDDAAAEAFATLATVIELLTQVVTADLREQRVRIATTLHERFDGDLVAVRRVLATYRPVSSRTLKDLINRRR